MVEPVDFLGTSVRGVIDNELDELFGELPVRRVWPNGCAGMNAMMVLNRTQKDGPRRR